MFNTATRLFEKKGMILFMTFLLVIGICSQEALSQEVIHSYKIIGEKRVPSYSGEVKEVSVEYDPLSIDHLILSNYDSKGVLLKKSHFLFTGNKFNLSNSQSYLYKKYISKDGISTTYAEDQSIVKEEVYAKGILQKQTIFYRDGTKHMTYNGDEKFLNGEFVMWHPNGQISFLGNYKNNLKDGHFESFDSSGKSERKGIYQKGKLTDGEPVIQELIFGTPEVTARFKDNDSNINELFRTKTDDLEGIKQLQESVKWYVDVTFTIDKTGQITALEIKDQEDTLNQQVIKSVFNEKFEGFEPALIEGIPVKSYLTKLFSISKKGLQLFSPYNNSEIDSISKSAINQAEEMPEFPGGDKGLRQFLFQTVRYPSEALEKKIQGKVFVSFVILEDGKVTNAFITKKVHPLLDAEAIRVVQLLPKWKAGRQDGKNVRVCYTLPINFVL